MKHSRCVIASQSPAPYRERVSAAQKIVATNADMGPKEIGALAELSQQAEETLISAARHMKLSARGYHRTIKLACTIADIAESNAFAPSHMLEALQYRQRDM